VDLNATDATAWYQDLDADGYGGGEPVVACTAPADRLPTGDDCDDNNAAIHPGMTELCDPLNVDEDCNGLADDADQSPDPGTWTSSWVDADADGYGDPSLQLWTCDIPAGCVTDGSDCNDSDGDIHPGAAELCDGQDNDCDGSSDQNAVDATAWYTDADADGYGAGTPTLACTAPSGLVPTADDCEDGNAAMNPAVTELCDPLDVDENCNGLADDADPNPDPATLTQSWTDLDGDGYGNATLPQSSCEIPAGAVADDSDCDDADGELWSGSPGLCDVALVYKNIFRLEDGTETEVAVDPYSVYTAVDAWAGGDLFCI
jgi:large repetitive protein